MREKDENKRIAIFKASIELINSIGFSGTSMSKIAKKAGLSPSTIYIYFANKEDLLNSLYLWAKEKLSHRLLENIDPSLSVKDTIYRFCENIYHGAQENSSYFLFLEQFSNSPIIKKIKKEEASSFFLPLIEILANGKKENIIKNISMDIISLFCFYPVLQLAKLHLQEGIKKGGKDLKNIQLMAWDAIKI